MSKYGSDLPRLPYAIDTASMPSGTCAYCGRTYWLDAANKAVLHEIPYCSEYEIMDPLDYAIKCRIAREKKTVLA